LRVPLLYQNLASSKGVVDLIPKRVPMGFKVCTIANTCMRGFVAESLGVLTMHFVARSHKVTIWLRVSLQRILRLTRD
jgi:hypothetical protein